ncbi:response regulator QseB, partial [Francisella tularensis subsp. holarctica]|nr:response regulator QseB [Francisella tularensis subsp. holarctica]
YDIVVLDIGMPIKTGLEVLRNIRNRGIKVPIILLTDRDGLEDRIKGLDLGADDYLTQPFELKELVARIKAISRRNDTRSGKSVNEEIRFGDYSFNPSS